MSSTEDQPWEEALENPDALAYVDAHYPESSWSTAHRKHVALAYSDGVKADHSALIMRGWSAAADALDRSPNGAHAAAAKSLRDIATKAVSS